MFSKSLIRTALGFVAAAVAATALIPSAAFAGPSDSPKPTPPPTRGTCPAYDAETLRAPYVFNYGLSGDALQEKFYGKSEDPADGSYNDDGYKPVRLTGYEDNGATKFATKWVNTGGPAWTSKFGLTDPQFHARFLELKEKGYRIVDASGYNTGAGVRYADIWEENTDGRGWAVTRDVAEAAVPAKVAEMQSKGLVPTHIEGYTLDGSTHFVITWTEGRNCKFKLETGLTGAQYQAFFDANLGAMRPVHTDSYTEREVDTRFATIFWAQSGPGLRSTHGQHWYLFQRSFNNNQCDGYVLDNFYAMEGSDGWNRFGGIWTYNAPVVVSEDSSLSTKVQRVVNCTAGRGGAAVINLTNGESAMSHADQSIAMASAVKPMALLSLLRKADAEDIDLSTTMLNVGAQYGSNGNNSLTANTEYSLEYLATIMITESHNWATNRLIDYVGMDTINDEIDALGLTVTTLDRYMSGAGSPSAHGLGDWYDDFSAGFDNRTTPREFATFYQLVWENDGLLSDAAYDKFFEITAQANTLANDLLPGGYDASFWNKAGSMTYNGIPGDYDHRPQLGAHQLTSEAGVMQLGNGDVIVYGVFLDERDTGSSASAIACIGMEAAREWSDDDPGPMNALCD
jgi:beta-lactamase class A